MAGTKGCSGRPRKVVAISTGVVTKKARLDRTRQEQELKLGRDELMQAPDWLSDDAKAEFIRVVRDASQVPFLDNLDLHFVAMYADAVDKYIKAAKHIQKNGLVCQDKNSGAIIPNPFINAQKKAEDTIFKCSARLGLATTDRLRLIVPKVQEDRAENKYLKYLKA